MRTSLAVVAASIALGACSGEPSPPSFSVGCLGDSITASSGYPRALSELLGPDYAVTNEGISGDTSAQVLRRYRERAAARRHDVVVVLAGTNDVGRSVPVDATVANLRALYDAALADGAIVVAVTVLPAGFSDEQHAARRAVNDAILERCGSTPRMACVDAASALDDGTGRLRGELTYDGMHLTAEGGRALAAEVARAFSAGAAPGR
jgi:lysophospholipase L1-like esterase